MSPLEDHWTSKTEDALGSVLDRLRNPSYKEFDLCEGDGC